MFDTGITTTTNRVDNARAVINEIEQAAKALGDAIATEQALEDNRCIAKSAALQRIMLTENPLTKKPHSASSAEAIVETDAEYAGYRAAQRRAVVASYEARGAFESAKLRAKLAVELVSMEGL